MHKSSNRKILGKIFLKLSDLLKPLLEIFRILFKSTKRYLSLKHQILPEALAYYAVFTIPPLLMVLLTIFGLVIKDDVMEKNLLLQLSKNIDPSITDLVLEGLKNLNNQSQFGIAQLVAFFGFSLGVAGLIDYLQYALNVIFDYKIDKKGLAKILRTQLLSWIIVLIFGGLWLASFVLDILFVWFNKRFLELPDFVAEIGGFGFIFVFFMCLYQVLIIPKISLKNLIFGSLFTVFLLRFARVIFNFYLSQSDVISAYSATATAIAFLVFLYIISHAVLFGANLIFVLEKESKAKKDGKI